jgi:hypothetical protein
MIFIGSLAGTCCTISAAAVRKTSAQSTPISKSLKSEIAGVSRANRKSFRARGRHVGSQVFYSGHESSIPQSACGGKHSRRL